MKSFVHSRGASGAYRASALVTHVGGRCQAVLRHPCLRLFARLGLFVPFFVHGAKTGRTKKGNGPVRARGGVQSLSAPRRRPPPRRPVSSSGSCLLGKGALFGGGPGGRCSHPVGRRPRASSMRCGRPARPGVVAARRFLALALECGGVRSPWVLRRGLVIRS